MATLITICLVLAVYWLCPKSEHHQPHGLHPHTQEMVIPTFSLQADGSSGGASSGPLPDLSWMGNSLHLANQVAIRNHQEYQRRARIAMSTVMNVS